MDQGHCADEAVKGGQEPDLGALRQRVYALAVKLTRDRVSAEDVAQETIARALSAGVSLDLPYLFRIAINFIRSDKRRAEHRYRAAEGPEAAVDPESSEPADILIVSENRERVWDALARLPEHEKEVMVLRFCESLSCSDIARIFDSTPNAVSCLLHRAKERMIVLLARRERPR